MARVPTLRAREVETILKEHGFVFVSQKGSHRKWRSADGRLQVIVPEHRGRDLPIGTLRALFVEAGIPEWEWKR